MVSAGAFYEEMLADARGAVLTNFVQEVRDVAETSTCYRDSAAERSLTKFLVKQSSVWLVLLTYTASSLVIRTLC